MSFIPRLAHPSRRLARLFAARFLLFVFFVAAAHENVSYPPAAVDMEGDGVVAVARAVAAGLTVGLITPLHIERSASQTISEAPQINNEPYASTYQVAHCGANALSPATCVTEFPPQRLNPSPTQGNFEVGNGFNRCISLTPNFENRRKIRRDDGFLPRPPRDRDVDAFVSSLRKYPNAERSLSMELLEKLLKAPTCLQKDSTADPHKIFGDKHAATKDQKKLHKRGKKDEANKSLSLKKAGNTQFDVRQIKTKTHAVKCHSPNRDVSVSSFDYLNSGVPWLPGEESRSRRDNRTLNSVFREIYQDEASPVVAFPVCPSMQSRYERHVKMYHPTTSQAPDVDTTNLSSCSRCLKKRPCPCEATKSRLRLIDKEEEERRALEDAIFLWLNDIPVYPNEKPHDKFIRDAIVKKLAETLSSIKNDEITTKGEEEIKKAIDKLPMWYPTDEKDRENFKNAIAASLLEKIKNIKDKDIFQQVAADFINTLKFDKSKDIDRDKILDDITKQLNELSLNRPEDDGLYRDMLKIKAFEMLDRLPIETRGNRYEYLNQLSDEFVDHLINAISQPIDAEYKQNLSKGIRDILDETGVSRENRNKVEKSLDNVLNDVLLQGMDKNIAEIYIRNALEGTIPDSKVDEITTKALALVDEIQEEILIHPETAQMIRSDLGGILDLSGVHSKHKDKVMDHLHKAVTNIITTDMDQEKARTHIKSILKGKVPDHKIANLTEEVLTLADQVTPVQAKTIDAATKQIIKEDISDILNSSNFYHKNRGKVEEGLHKAVADIVRKDMDQEKAKAHIKAVLKGKMSVDEMEEVTEQILTLADRVKPAESKTIDHETKLIIKENVSDILHEHRTHVKNRNKVEDDLHKAVAHIITKDMDRDQAITHIKKVLKGKVSDHKLEDIAEQVLTSTNQITLSQGKTIDEDTKQIIKEDISTILDLSNADIKNRRKVEESLQKSVADIITKGMDKDKAMTHIKTVLRGKVSADKIEDIAEQVLTLADQVTPPETKKIDAATKQIIKEDISDILNSSNFYHKNRGKIEEGLHKAVTDIVRSDMSEEKAKAHIKTVLKGKISDDKIDDITEQVLKLADQVKPAESKTIDHETKQIIKEDVNNILHQHRAHVKNRDKLEGDLHKAVHHIITKDMDKDKAINHIKKVLKGRVSDHKVEDIAKQVLTLAGQVTPKTVDYETKQIIKEEVNDILDSSSANIKNKSKVKENLHKTVANIIAKGMNKDKALTQIKSVLKGKVSEEAADDIAQQVLQLVDAVSEKDGRDNQSMSHSELQQSIRDNLSNILDHTDGHITNRSKVEDSLRDILKDLVMRGMDKSEAQDHIHSILKGNVPDSQTDNISKKIFALADQLKPSFLEYSGGPSAFSTLNAEKMYFDQVFEVIRDWVRNRGLAQLKDTDLNRIAEIIANDVVDRQKYIQLNPGVKTSDEKECEILKEQIYNALYKSIDNKSVLSVMPDVENLMRSLKEIPKLLDGGLVLNSIEFVQENLEGALLDWLRGSPIYQYKNSTNRQAQEQAISNLARSLTAILSSQMKEKSGAKTDALLLKEITRQLEELPLESQFKSKEYIRMLASHMLDYLKNLQLFQDISVRTDLKDTQRMSFMPSTNHLNDVVKNWCEALPLPDTAEGSQIKQDLANKIILKIGELNMNQDIFNDNLLYEEMLQDFIDQQIKALNIDLNVTEDSKHLIDEIIKVKHKVQDNLIGRAYKQQLRDTVSNTLPSLVCPTEEDLASFELMKDNLADAFINLHYSGENDDLRAKFKRRIKAEVNKFVNEYLDCCPAPPVSTRKLNENLYKALKNVPVPDDDSMRSEVEAVRLKDVIDNWLKLLPLDKQTKAEQLHTNKIVTLMCQKLHELENEFNPDFDEIAAEEIKKYLEKLPLRNRNNLDRMAKILVERIITTNESRSFIEGTLADDLSLEKNRRPPYQYHHNSIASRASYLSCDTPIPSCDCKKDKKVNQRFKQRSQQCEAGTQSAKLCCRDAALDPPPSDLGSQTEMMFLQSKSCQCDEKSENFCSKPICSKTKRNISAPPTGSMGCQADLFPFSRHTKYHWDCIPAEKRECACQTLTQRPPRRCLPLPIIAPQGLCQSRNCISPQRRFQRPRSCTENSSPRGVKPRRQVASACPNDYVRHPKPHNCMRSHDVLPKVKSRSRRVVEPSCCRKKRSCEGPPCPKCYGLNSFDIPCPHPTCLYFK